jgi:hypothetical protein
MATSQRLIRVERSAAALRENLKRRKAQVRARHAEGAGANSAVAGSESDSIPGTDSRQPG